MNLTPISKALLGATLAAGALAAQAQTQGLSIGGSLGNSHWKGDAIGGAGTDTSDTGGKLYLGYGLTPNFSLEGGYVRFGKFTSPAGQVKADGAFLDAVGTWPVANGFSVLGRAGLFNGKLDSSIAGSDRGTSWKLGAGVQYDFDPRLAVRAEWERYRFDALNSKPDTDLYSVGLHYRF